jgi:hypothetical protein
MKVLLLLLLALPITLSAQKPDGVMYMFHASFPDLECHEEGSITLYLTKSDAEAPSFSCVLEIMVRDSAHPEPVTGTAFLLPDQVDALAVKMHDVKYRTTHGPGVTATMSVAQVQCGSAYNTVRQLADTYFLKIEEIILMVPGEDYDKMIAAVETFGQEMRAFTEE